MRRKLLEDIYNKMSDEEKRTFVQLTLQDKSHQEIMEALSRQRAQLESIEKKQNWVTDFGSDVAANFLTDGLIFFGRKLFGKL
ncbi:hypothetical protein [Prevotella sp. tc2-28]|uniref:hypothetical protein n=1 Tax=Prevotella sp. tc2-28 TaxID=1761888 RepID=UPI0015A0A514|nr:hypothetical protein [Prevotella sp. tc2-28]